ncbi:MAG: hypothetical protein DME20_06510 [Verrucomicrobia bacterium]|nr:MAG: hypothetical protein DME20_06510 [Verrucomicrobiota bacterium]
MAQGKMWAIASIQTSELRRLSVPYCRLPSESAVRPRAAKAHRPLTLPPDDRPWPTGRFWNIFRNFAAGIPYKKAMKRSAGKADIWILRQGTLTLVRPLTQRASEWISQHVQDDPQWFGPALVLEHDCLADLRNRMIEDGLHVT